MGESHGKLRKIAGFDTELKGNEIGPEYVFWCDGCNTHHWFRTGPGSPRWDWNGDWDKPTVTPSIDVNRSKPQSRCHSHVTDGKITYLTDSFHHLAGLTVNLKDVDW